MNKEITSTGINFVNFGTNNYTNDMELVIFSPDDITPIEVHKLEGFWLNPSKEPNSSEIFALKGTQEQYITFYNEFVETKACCEAGRNVHHTDETTRTNLRRNYEADFINSYQAWFDKLLCSTPEHV